MERPWLSIVVAVLCLVAVVAGAALVFSKWGSPPTGRSNTIAANLDYDDPASQATPIPIDPVMIAYRQVAEFRVPLKKVTCLAVGLDDCVFVGGDHLICCLDSEGRPRSRIRLTETPTCLAIGNLQHASPGRIYVAVGGHVQVHEPSGVLREGWQGMGEKARLTSLAAAERDVFVADAGNRVVWRFDTRGTLLDPIGQVNSERRSSGLRGSGEFLDLVAGLDELLYVVNPGEHRIEAYTFQGMRESRWGRGSPAVEDFAGAENPAHLALLSDGRFVTAEKGNVRIKVYTPEGRFENVVCSPEQAGDVVDLATDRKRRILVLDRLAGAVRIFEAKKPPVTQPEGM